MSILNGADQDQKDRLAEAKAAQMHTLEVIAQAEESARLAGEHLAAMREAREAFVSVGESFARSIEAVARTFVAILEDGKDKSQD